VKAPNTWGSARSKHVAARSSRVAPVRSKCAVAVARNSRAVEVRNNMDAMKMRRVDRKRPPDLPKAAGSYCTESHPAS
jgi:hypothetical protein